MGVGASLDYGVGGMGRGSGKSPLRDSSGSRLRGSGESLLRGSSGKSPLRDSSGSKFRLKIIKERMPDEGGEGMGKGRVGGEGEGDGKSFGDLRE